ncbi:lysoplasmalogenase family protein [Algibacter sp. AS12]|uniref:lysoplasmalogenase family protein n=1 Tax=Algibacter sp. AS12 TaxID=3135773 RepID=UPI00398A83A1
MAVIFKNNFIFAVLFFSLLIADILIKLNLGVSPFRFVSKSLLSILLFVYYLLNEEEEFNANRLAVAGALIFFIIGDNMLILNQISVYNILGICCFIIAKVFYVLRFYNNRDFNFKKLIPFFMLCFIYMAFLLIIIIENLNSQFYFITLVYLFVASTTLIFGVLRGSVVNKTSFYLVMLGIIASVLSDSISVLELFYVNGVAYQEITIMLFYGISQYFIILGIVNETQNKVVIEE